MQDEVEEKEEEGENGKQGVWQQKQRNSIRRVEERKNGKEEK